MVLKSYFDAGNQGDSSQYDVLSLAVISGTKEEWKPFERDWKKFLRRHRATFLHVTDLLTRNDIYENWTDKQISDFLKDGVKVAIKHVGRGNREDRPGRFGLLPLVTSFVLKDFVEARIRDPERPDNVNESCLRMAIAEVLDWAQDQASCDEVWCFFDQGEPFFGHLCHLLTNKKALREASLLNLIKHRSEDDMRRVPALQLADLYAWSVSHLLDEDKPKWQIKLLKNDWVNLWFDKNSKFKPEVHQVWKSWKLPKRKPTK